MYVGLGLPCVMMVVLGVTGRGRSPTGSTWLVHEWEGIVHDLRTYVNISVYTWALHAYIQT